MPKSKINVKTNYFSDIVFFGESLPKKFAQNVSVSFVFHLEITKAF
jgi:hypothetical protein